MCGILIPILNLDAVGVGVMGRLSFIGTAPILLATLAMWSCLYLMYSGCDVAWPLLCLQRLLCGMAPILFAALAVWHCPYPICSACCVVLILS